MRPFEAQPKNLRTACSCQQKTCGSSKNHECQHEPHTQSSAQLVDQLNRIPGCAILLVLLAGLFHSGSGAAVKQVHLNPIAVLLYSSAIQALVCLPIILWKKLPVTGVRGEKLLLLLSSVTGSAAVFLLMIAYQSMPLADAMSIYASNSLFVILMCDV